MAPIRRYLRITAYSVLEVRIYLDNPADASRWLLGSSDPALPRIIKTVRPLVLPKLREENERARKPGGSGKTKKKSVKDVVAADDFEVSIFLTELGTAHSLLTRAKVFDEGGKASNGGNGVIGGGTADRPVEVGDDGDEDGDGSGVAVPNLRTEDSDEMPGVDMAAIPLAGQESKPVEVPDSDSDDEMPPPSTRSSTRGQGRRRVRGGAKAVPPPARSKDKKPEQSQDDKKKLGFRTNYDGFRIHGRILCLVVKRKGGPARNRSGAGQASQTGQAVMESWIASTQDNAAMLDE